jgi:formylglycine-generating enzyme required for sulfatase activity
MPPTAKAQKPVARPQPAKAPGAAAKNNVAAAHPAARETVINVSPLGRAQEKAKYPNFTNSIGAEMLLVTSGAFSMGSDRPDATPQEQPVTRITLGCFYMAQFPITNAQYEMFDASHKAKRAPWADDHHPVIYVSSVDAEKFCHWLSTREGKKYRLPTEAEWEFAARGPEGRAYPWGDQMDAGHYANFADARTNFAWREVRIDDGFAETSPIGAFPRGASHFGMEEMAGNVFEWCLDYFENYKGKPRVNPRGPTQGARRIYRGGSWKSRVTSLRASARHFNVPEYSSNDVGFRIICECE